VTILIQSALALLLVLGSALIFNQILELDGPRRGRVVPARPAIRRRPRTPTGSLKKAA
jgi:hypothetical protein